ncbi:hypothetical protein O6H91_07G094100 [Diphasiastrum complanatum]|uniref:Uncharacterized protein n=1 Tax=Diphasiastrum complanatum TaxID=34168 RepID=A0ACC2D7J6_DIPCM|nr:hypothetical protein O6H91_07G094100 [Diphasiastrum complanatum]
MDGSHTGPAKRSRSQLGSESAERNGRNKRRSENGSGRFLEPFKSSSDEIIYRVLCPGSRIGSVIGKGGSIIKSLRQETGAKIKIEDGIPGVDERVISIATPGKARDKGSERSRRDKEHDDAPDESEAANVSDEGSLPSVQEALFKVHARIVDEENLSSDGDDTVTARLLVPNSQIGCLLGKGGKVIEQMRSETTAQIRILPKEQLPGCALPTDELVQISGDWKVVRKALHAVGSKLYENPPKDRPNRGTLAANRSSGGLFSAGTFFPEGNSLVSSGITGSFGLAPQLSSFGSVTTGTAGNWPYGSSEFNVVPGLSGSYESQKDVPEEEFVIRILCPDDKIGSIIGRGGNLIRQMREGTRAKIKIEDAVPDSDERVISISSFEAANSSISPTLEAALQLQSRIADLTMEKDAGNATTRLLVPSKNIGCLLGKGGSVITEMRKLTRANIRVMSKESLPRCALDSDELVQIVDDINVARDALIQIVSRLRENLFKEYLKSVVGSKGSTKFWSGLGNQGTNFDRRLESRSSEDLHHVSGLDVESAVRSSYGTSTGTWAYQGGSGGVSLGALSTYGSTVSQPTGLYGRSSALVANVASKTLEIKIPSTAVGAVLGKGGNNIAHIRQVSGAKVKLHDGKSGSLERTIEISGTPEQTQTAQSLLEAFINSESSF